MHISSRQRTALCCALVFSLALVAGTAMAENVTSQGDGYWTNPLTWDPGVPGGADDVFIASGDTVTIDGLDTIHINSLTVTGTLTHVTNNTTEADKIILDITNSCTVVSGGAIDVSYKGYAQGQGPGKNDGRGAAGHGGEGGLGFQASDQGPVYGSITNPVNCGSGAKYQKGGGVVILAIGGALTNNGTIAANGEGLVSEGVTGGGSGGSVNIAAKTIAGNGLITANGGVGEYLNAGGGGGGGRVAIRLTQSGATFDSYAITNISALGGDGGPNQTGEDGAAGTVYLKTQDQAYGDLIVKNSGTSTAALTLLTNATYRFASITTTNYGLLVPGTNAVLDLTGCTLHSDSTISNITSRIVIGHANSSITWPAAFTNHGALSWKGTNVYPMTTDLTIASGGILTHEVSNNESDKVNLSITGNLTIDAGGVIDTWARGYYTFSGPGAAEGTGDKRGGAGHGGEGGWGQGVSVRSTTYGSITDPDRHGSGAKSYTGGGAVILSVSGALTNNGLITAKGDGTPPYTSSGGGSGGSVNLTVATLAGNGTITADGGVGEYLNAGGGGGGGRIAIRLTQGGATFDSFPLANITARGADGGSAGADDGAGGTVYLKCADETYGDLIVDSDHATPAQTLIPTNLADTALLNVMLRDQASVNLPTGQSFTVYGDWSNAAPTDAFSGGGSVVFAGSETGTVYGSSEFEVFLCTNLAKTLVFEAGASNAMTTEIRMQGVAEAVGSYLKLRSTQPGTQWKLNVMPSVASDKKTFQYLDVKDSDARSPGTAVSAVNSTNSLNNSNWVFAVVGQTNTWTGVAGTTWSDGGNWSLTAPPTLDDAKVVIPTSMPNYPELDGTVLINALEMQSGTSLQLSDETLAVNGAASIAGTITAAGSETVTFYSNIVFSGGGTFTAAQSTVKFAATGPQTFTPLGNTFHILEITNTAAVTITDGFTTETLDLSATSANVIFQGGFTAYDVDAVLSSGGTLTFTATKTYTVNNHLHVRGTSGNLVTLTGGGSWALNVNGHAVVRYASVANSDATGGRTIYAADSTDGGSNPNWVFNTAKMWVGTTDAWTTDGNWSPSGAPGATDVVLIDGTASTMPNLTSGTNVAGLTVVGIGGAASLTVDMPFAGPDVLSVSGHAEIRTNATLTHTQGDETYRLAMNIGTNLIIDAGGAIDVSYKGYGHLQGPGKNDGRGAAGHGGEGGLGFEASDQGPVYGSITNPVNCGSGAKTQKGGGVVILAIGGALTNNGTIAANGEGLVSEGVTGGGSGGSVNIAAKTIAGNGLITANGGVGEYLNAGGGGGGGRVAIRLTQSGATFDSYAITNISALGGDGGPNQTGEDGAAGTVYLKTQDQAYGDLIVKNSGTSTAALTLLTNATYRFASITTTNYGLLVPGTNAVLDLTGCTLHSDSTISNITSRIVIGHANSSITWPAAFTNHGALSWKGTNVYPMTTDLTIASGGILTHEVSNNESDKVNLSITGNLTIDAGGVIDTWARGYYTFSGPGAAEGTGDKRGGAGHGGEGGWGQGVSVRSTTYGSITDPDRHGSGAKSYTGGGAVILSVSGALTNNGLITAKGDGTPPYTSSGGGSGGSVNLTVATLAGNGTITADGGVGEYLNAGGGGGGGRIAIRLTQGGATFDSFPLANITARGADGGPYGADDGAAGTVYLETQAQGSGGGTVTIDNHWPTTGARTHILPSTYSVLDELEGAMVVLTNKAQVQSTTNVLIGDILIYTNCYWTLGSWTVTVDVAEHSLEDLLSPDPDHSTNRVDNYDQIIWMGLPDGMVILLR